MYPRDFASFRRSAALLAVAAVVLVAVPLQAASIELGPPPGAALAPDKLSRIDEFLNGEIAAGKIPGAIVLIQRHGRPIYFRIFGKRDVAKAKCQLLVQALRLDGREDLAAEVEQLALAD